MSLISFGSNLASLVAIRRLNAAEYEMGLSFQRLASGLRINRASDDAAGLAISTSLNKDARVYTQALRNGNDAISALGIAEGTVSELSTVLTRLRELASQAASGTFSRTQRVALNQEARSLTDEFNRLTASTTFNGLNLLNGTLGRMNIQLGYGTLGTIGFELGGGLERNVGTGFEEGILNTIGSSIFSHTVGDFTGDGKLDALTADGMELYLARGNGDGTFSTVTRIYSNAVDNVDEVVAGDFNSDGKMDIAASVGSSIRLFLGDGSGGFTLTSTVATSNSYDRELKVGDINGDGKLDLVGAGNDISVFIGNGSGGLTASTSFSPDFSVNGITLADLNGDGRDDVAYTMNQDIYIHQGLSDGTISSYSTTTSGFNLSGDIEAADLNSDGIMDLVYSGDSTDLAVRLGNGDGTFKAVSLYAATGGFSHLKIADLDGDGLLDVVGVQGDPMIFKGRGDGTFDDVHTELAVAIGDGALMIGDFNGDGVNDFSLNGSGGGDLVVTLSSTEISTTMQRLNLSSRVEALAALSTIDSAMARVQRELGAIGSNQSRILSALSNLASLRENSVAAEARIKDVDVASESARLTRFQILRQTSGAVLAQANLSPRIALSLLGDI